MAVIESVTLTEPQNPESKHFHIKICLGITLDYASVTMPKLMKWFETTCVDDPKKYEEELQNSKIEFSPLPGSNMFEIKVSGQETQKLKLTWISGLDALHSDESGRHLIMSEYIQDTPVTRAIVQELYNVSLNESNYGYPEAVVNYIEPLLYCLYMHWD